MAKDVKHTKLLELPQEEFKESQGVTLELVKIYRRDEFYIAMLQVKDAKGLYWVLFDRGETPQHALNCVLYKSTLPSTSWKYDAGMNASDANVNITRA